MLTKIIRHIFWSLIKKPAHKISKTYLSISTRNMVFYPPHTWIAPEGGNVLVDPLEGRHLVDEAVVGHRAAASRARVGVQVT